MAALKRRRLWLALVAWPVWTLGTIPFFEAVSPHNRAFTIIWEAGVGFVTVVLVLEVMRALRRRGAA
jgi:hypothetical protein